VNGRQALELSDKKTATHIQARRLNLTAPKRDAKTAEKMQALRLVERLAKQPEVIGGSRHLRAYGDEAGGTPGIHSKKKGQEKGFVVLYQPDHEPEESRRGDDQAQEKKKGSGKKNVTFYCDITEC